MQGPQAGRPGAPASPHSLDRARQQKPGSTSNRNRSPGYGHSKTPSGQAARKLWPSTVLSHTCRVGRVRAPRPGAGAGHRAAPGLVLVEGRSDVHHRTRPIRRRRRPSRRRRPGRPVGPTRPPTRQAVRTAPPHRCGGPTVSTAHRREGGARHGQWCAVRTAPPSCRSHSSGPGGFGRMGGGPVPSGALARPPERWDTGRTGPAGPPAGAAVVWCQTIRRGWVQERLSFWVLFQL